MSSKMLEFEEADPKMTSNRPKNLPFIQQTLPTKYPILNAGYIFPWFFFTSLCFMGLGIGIFYYAESIQEQSFDYSDCKSLEYPSLTCEEVLNGAVNRQGLRPIMMRRHKQEDDEEEDDDDTELPEKCTCIYDFTLDEDMNGTIYMYYALTNFYQNHLRYYTNRDENQLRGKIGNITKPKIVDPSSFCKPEHLAREEGSKKVILPCGLQANSMFMDEITLVDCNNDNCGGNETKVPLNRTGIAWESDKTKFENPEGMRNPKDPNWGIHFAKPPSWKKHLWELDSNLSNNGMQNEDFMIWMRTAAFSNFRKLYRIVDKRKLKYQNGLPAGQYRFFIEYNYKISSFDGTKSIILTNSRMTGGRNYFLATAYGATGLILFVLFVVFLIIHLFTRNRDICFKLD